MGYAGDSDPYGNKDYSKYAAAGLIFFELVVAAAGIAVVLISAPLNLDAESLLTTVILLGTAMVLGFLWYWAPANEQRLLTRIGDGIVPDAPNYILALVIIAAVSFLVLMVASVSPATFAVVLLVIKFIETANARLAGRRIFGVLQQIWGSRSLPSAQVRRGVTLQIWKLEADIIDDFFFDRPWYLLAVTETVLVGLAGILGAYVAREPDPFDRHVGLAVSTAVLVFTVAFNEVVAAVWRHTRSLALARLVPTDQEPPAASRRDRRAEVEASSSDSTARDIQ